MKFKTFVVKAHYSQLGLFQVRSRSKKDAKEQVRQIIRQRGHDARWAHHWEIVIEQEDRP
jgi:hypothetical protein